MGKRPWAGMAEQCRVGLSSLPLPPHLGPARAVRGRGTSPAGVWTLNSHWGSKANLRKEKK